MLANFEKRNYEGKERVWTGRYRNLHNLPHWHLESELIYIEKGTVTVSDNHRRYTLDSGDAVFLGSGEIHYIKSGEDSIVEMALPSSRTCWAGISSARPSLRIPIPFWNAWPKSAGNWRSAGLFLNFSAVNPLSP